jgi:hypothetical protein
MNLFKKVFGNNTKREGISEYIPESKEVLIGISSAIKDKLPESAKIIAESQIPAYCMIGNLIFDKKYNEAIELGNKLLEKTPCSAGVHVNLMDAYFKIRNENPIFYDKATEHARLAMLYGHNTGYVQKRLAINLEKQGKIYQAIQICNIVISDKFHFSKHGCGNKVEFVKRKETLINKITNAADKEDDIFFTNEEVSFLIEQIRLDEEREIKEQDEYEKRMRLLEKELVKDLKF